MADPISRLDARIAADRKSRIIRQSVEEKRELLAEIGAPPSLVEDSIKELIAELELGF